jgi:hypothetical protein
METIITIDKAGLAKLVADTVANSQGSIEVAFNAIDSETNGYDVTTSLLNAAGGVLSLLGLSGAAFAPGTGIAASANVSVSFLVKFVPGTLTPSDILSLTGTVAGAIAAFPVVMTCPLNPYQS